MHIYTFILCVIEKNGVRVFDKSSIKDILTLVLNVELSLSEYMSQLYQIFINYTFINL
jgi:hypothetical protein